MTDRNRWAAIVVEEEQRADLRLWADRYARVEPCPRCLWPFGDFGHLCVAEPAGPTAVDGEP
ncbi:MAG: hypothetical protein PHS14_21265 [Elusimicrobia bacterium]|nr:hypothetical protein [Elusimicrobiota bacterium]